MKKFSALVFLALLTGSLFGAAGSPVSGRVFGLTASFGFMVGEGEPVDRLRIGGLIHLSPQLVLSPSFAFMSLDKSEEDVLLSQPSKEDDTQWEVGLGVYYYLNVSRDFSVFFGPAFRFLSYGYDDYNSSGDLWAVSQETLTVELRFGVQYMPWSQVGLYASLGVGVDIFSRTEESFNNLGVLLSTTVRDQTTWHSLNAILGIVLYL